MVVETVKKTIEKYKLIKREDKILVAYSGGVDSTALLTALLELRKDWALDLFLGHFNHRLRPGALEDEQFVRKVAQRRSLPLFVGSEDVRTYARGRRLNLEEAGRVLRYDFLIQIAQKIGDAKIATGHTINDQAETFFMRLLRGSGLRGLGSIFPVVEGRIIRPLLFVERREIEAYLRKERIDFRQDESNLDKRLTRNKIRLDLIPYIQENFEPKIITRISRVVSILQEEEDLLERLTHMEAQETVIQKKGEVCLDLNATSALPRGLARRVVRDFIKKLKGDLRGISFDDVESILELEERKSFHLKKRFLLVRDKDLVCLRKIPSRKIEYEYVWSGDRPLMIDELHLTVEAKRLKPGSSPFAFDDDSRAFLDGKKVRFPIKIRNRREGDRYQPFGAPGQKKLKEIMRAKGIALEERDRRPVFVFGDEIIWILGFPVGEKCKIDDKSEEVIEIRVSTVND
jgi:tRNA(Ile)-lysidine synthase